MLGELDEHQSARSRCSVSRSGQQRDRPRDPAVRAQAPKPARNRRRGQCNARRELVGRLRIVALNQVRAGQDRSGRASARSCQILARLARILRALWQCAARRLLVHPADSGTCVDNASRTKSKGEFRACVVLCSIASAALGPICRPVSRAQSAAPAPAAKAAPPPAPRLPLEAGEGRAVALKLADDLVKSFVFRDQAEAYAAMLRKNAAAGRYDSGTRGELAKLMTDDLQAVHKDGHLHVSSPTRRKRARGGEAGRRRVCRR